MRWYRIYILYPYTTIVWWHFHVWNKHPSTEYHRMVAVAAFVWIFIFINNECVLDFTCTTDDNNFCCALFCSTRSLCVFLIFMLLRAFCRPHAKAFAKCLFIHERKRIGRKGDIRDGIVTVWMQSIFSRCGCCFHWKEHMCTFSPSLPHVSLPFYRITKIRTHAFICRARHRESFKVKYTSIWAAKRKLGSFHENAIDAGCLVCSCVRVIFFA